MEKKHLNILKSKRDGFELTSYNESHLICHFCGVLLECDWMGIGMDFDDPCPKNIQGYHRPNMVKCDCEQKVKVNG